MRRTIAAAVLFASSLTMTACVAPPPATTLRGVIRPGPDGQLPDRIHLQYSQVAATPDADGQFELTGVNAQTDKLIIEQEGRTFVLIIKMPMDVTLCLGELDPWSLELGFLVVYLSAPEQAHAYLARSAYATSLQEMNIMNVGVALEGGQRVIHIHGLSDQHPQSAHAKGVRLLPPPSPEPEAAPTRPPSREDIMGWIEPVMTNLHVNLIAGVSGMATNELTRLLTAAGLDVTAWDQFVHESKLPGPGEGGFTPENLLRIALAMSDAIQPEALAALALRLTGLEPEELQAWSRRNLIKVLRNDDGSFTQLATAAVLAMLHQTRKLKEMGVTEFADLADLVSEQPTKAGTYLLYEAAQGTTPDQQGWLYLIDPLDTAARVAWRDQTTILDTSTTPADKAGFFTEDPLTGPILRHPGMPVLDRQTGFSVSFALRIDREEHHRDDRAGFSMLVICNDLLAIEFGFWKGRVWAQADDGTPLFQDSRAETARFSPSVGLVPFTLEVLGDTYRLLSGDDVVLEGKLRNYSGFGGFPYNTPNFIFAGDNTTSAGAVTRLGDIRVELTRDAAAVASYFKPAVLHALGLKFIPQSVDEFLKSLPPEQWAALMKFSAMPADADMLASLSPEELTALAAVARRLPGGALIAGQPMGGASLLFRAFGYTGPGREKPVISDVQRKNMITAEQMARLAEKARRLKAATELLEKNRR